MVEAPISHMPGGTGLSQISWKPSELLTNYERLLRLHKDELQKDEFFNPHQLPLMLFKAFSPSYLKRFWKRVAPMAEVPNTLGQDLGGGAIILQELERLNDQTLRGVAECNRINYRRLLQRSAFGYLPWIFSAVGLVLGLFKTLKESVGVDTFAAPTSAVWYLLVPSAVGLLLGSRPLASRAASGAGS